MGGSPGVGLLGVVALMGAIYPKADTHSRPTGKIKLFMSPFFRDSPSQDDGNASFGGSGSQCRCGGGLEWGGEDVISPPQKQGTGPKLGPDTSPNNPSPPLDLELCVLLLNGAL